MSLEIRRRENGGLRRSKRNKDSNKYIRRR